MRTTRRGLIGAAVALSSPHVARAARRNLTVAGVGAPFEQNYKAAVVDPFRRAHPDIDVTYYPAGNSEQILSLLRGRRTLPPIDVALLELTVAKAATDDGLLTVLPRDALPVLAGLPDSAFTDGVAGPAAMLDCLALAYAPQRIKPPPNSWRFLWEKALAGQIALNPAPDSSGVALTLVANALFGSEGERGSLIAGITALSAIAPGVATWEPIPDELGAIMSGAVSLGVDWNARGQMLARAAPGKIAMAIPLEGSVFQVITINQVRASRDADAARAFIAHALGAEAQTATAERLFYTPVNPGAVLSTEALSRTASSPERRAQMMEVDWLQVATMREEITRAWGQRILHRG